jgi:hypothetical protein
MKRFFLALLLSLQMLSSAHADPVADPAGPVLLPQELSSDEKAILKRGKIGPAAHVSGGLAGTLLGFGSGHVLQRRWRDSGWIFTAGESLGVLVMMTAIPSCFKSVFSGIRSPSQGGVSCGAGTTTSVVLGFYLFAGLRVWESVDVWLAPFRLNREFHKVKEKSSGLQAGLFPAPMSGGRVGLAGILRF